MEATYIIVQAGGKGTRLSQITKDEIPKPMVSILGKPLLEWQIEKLKENKITEIILIVGHRKEKILSEKRKKEVLKVGYRFKRLFNG